jgi:exodeoxyribonuclease-3
MYTFWDYQGGAFDRNRGVRIDHFLLSAAIAERLIDVKIDRTERNRANPSDHAPVIAIIE